MQVIRLERRYLNLPPPYGVMAVSVDYVKVLINADILDAWDTEII